jgi:hypothetical protein
MADKHTIFPEKRQGGSGRDDNLSLEARLAKYSISSRAGSSNDSEKWYVPPALLAGKFVEQVLCNCFQAPDTIGFADTG